MAETENYLALPWPDNLLTDISAQNFAPILNGAKRPPDFKGSLEYALCSLSAPGLFGNLSSEVPPETAIRLHYQEQLSCAEIAKRLNVTAYQVQNVIKSCLKHLNQLFFIEFICIGIKAHTEYSATAAWRLGYQYGLSTVQGKREALGGSEMDLLQSPEGAPNFDPSTTVEALPVSKRCLNSLKRANIHTMYELLSKDEEELRKMPSIGKSTIEEVRAELQKVGLEFGCIHYSDYEE